MSPKSSLRCRIHIISQSSGSLCTYSLRNARVRRHFVSDSPSHLTFIVYSNSLYSAWAFSYFSSNIEERTNIRFPDLNNSRQSMREEISNSSPSMDRYSRATVPRRDAIHPPSRGVRVLCIRCISRDECQLPEKFGLIPSQLKWRLQQQQCKMMPLQRQCVGILSSASCIFEMTHSLATASWKIRDGSVTYLSLLTSGRSSSAIELGRIYRRILILGCSRLYLSTGLYSSVYPCTVVYLHCICNL